MIANGHQHLFVVCVGMNGQTYSFTTPEGEGETSGAIYLARELGYPLHNVSFCLGIS